MSASDPVEIAAQGIRHYLEQSLPEVHRGGPWLDEAMKHHREQAQAMIQALNSAGFKIMAREATGEMMEAGGDSQFRNWSEAYKHNMKVYKKGGVADCQWLAPTFADMWDAAPAYGTPGANKKPADR